MPKNDSTTGPPRPIPEELNRRNRETWEKVSRAETIAEESVWRDLECGIEILVHPSRPLEPLARVMKTNEGHHWEVFYSQSGRGTRDQCIETCRVLSDKPNGIASVVNDVPVRAIEKAMDGDRAAFFEVELWIERIGGQ